MIFSHLVFSKWVARIFSLVLAIILWQYVYFQDQGVEQIVFPLEFDNYPNNLYTKDENLKDKMVIAQIFGKKSKIREVYSILSNIRCYVNLANAREGYNKYKISFERNSSTNWALKNVRIEFKDNFISIPFEKKVKRSIPINLNMNDKFRKKFSEIGTIDYYPKVAKVYGPESYITRLNYIQSKFFNFENKYGNFNITLPIENLEQPLKIISPNNINVYVRFNSDIKDIRFKNVNIMFVNNIKNLTVLNSAKIKLKYVIYRGPENIIKSINKKSLVSYIDLHNYKKTGKYLAFVHPQEFEHIEVIDYAPKQIKISIISKKLF